ncbi:MAG TPA: hypothetical protein VGD08_20270 [Stellaceae bacterium]|jgi:hypothetical protein
MEPAEPAADVDDPRRVALGFRLPMTQQQIGDYLGLTAVHINHHCARQCWAMLHVKDAGDEHRETCRPSF